MIHADNVVTHLSVDGSIIVIREKRNWVGDASGVIALERMWRLMG